MTSRLRMCLAAVAISFATGAAAQQGVTDTEITLGSIQDLSGPIASVSKQARAGLQMRVDEINEAGGIHGRKIRLIVEDAGYDPKRAVLAAEKLVNRDRIFALLGHVGTAHNNATNPIQFEKNVINFLPLSGGNEMFEPPHRLKFAWMPPYLGQTRDAVVKLVKDNNFKRPCTMYQDDEAGQEILRGGEDGLKIVGLEFVEKTSYKRGATDFSSQMTKLAAANCDFVVLGTIIRETVGGVAAAKKIGFNPVFLAPFPAYTDLIHKLGGPALDGLYATMTAQMPYLDDSSEALRKWAQKYKEKAGEDPSVFSVYGYMIVDVFAKAAERAGRGLTTDSFIAAMEVSPFPSDIFGSSAMTFTAQKRLGNPAARLSQIKNGKWQVISDYLPAAK